MQIVSIFFGTDLLLWRASWHLEASYLNYVPFLSQVMYFGHFCPRQIWWFFCVMGTLIYELLSVTNQVCPAFVFQFWWAKPRHDEEAKNRQSRLSPKRSIYLEEPLMFSSFFWATFFTNTIEKYSNTLVSANERALADREFDYFIFISRTSKV